MRTLVAILALGWAAPALAQNGTLRVTSFPDGASLFVDGAATGRVTPTSISLPVGTHQVRVAIAASGWRDATATVDVVSGTNDLSVTLLPLLTQGEQGPAGESVVGLSIGPGDDPNCPAGGSKFTVGGVVSYACNGVAGERGPSGPEGPMGPQGLPGSDGSDGATGATGAQGATGARGPSGPTGAAGAAGGHLIVGRNFPIVTLTSTIFDEDTVVTLPLPPGKYLVSTKVELQAFFPPTRPGGYTSEEIETSNVEVHCGLRRDGNAVDATTTQLNGWLGPKGYRINMQAYVEVPATGVTMTTTCGLRFPSSTTIKTASLATIFASEVQDVSFVD